MSESYTSGGYRIELLKADNWMPWKRRMLAVLQDLGLEKYITKDAKSPTVADPDKPTKEEAEVIDKWKEGDARTRTRIELAIGDAEMVHISGASTTCQMWDQLSTVKESKGHLGVMAARRALYQTMAKEGFDMVTHISRLCQTQEELHVMGNLISDEDFIMMIATSLPGSWDNYMSSFLGSRGNKPSITSHELIAILLEEDRRRKARNGESSGTALHVRAKGKGKPKATDKECYNCHKTGHLARDCYAKGGAKEGQGPRGRKKGNRANQAEEINTSLNDCAYMAVPRSHEISKNDWLLDSATTSHICTTHDAFTEFYTVSGATVKGVGPEETAVEGRGTVILKFEFDGKVFSHQLRNTLYVPNATNCLLSLGRFEEGGGKVEFEEGQCWMKDKDRLVVGKGYRNQRLYVLAAHATQLGQERTNYVSTTRPTWDQWHRQYGHISISALQQLEKEGLVNGLTIDQSSIPSKTCEACIQAKQSHKPFPQEAKNRSKVPGERVLTDVWGPA